MLPPGKIIRSFNLKNFRLHSVATINQGRIQDFLGGGWLLGCACARILHHAHFQWNYFHKWAASAKLLENSALVNPCCIYGVKLRYGYALSVCVSVTTKSAAYLIYASGTRCHRVLYGVFKVFIVMVLFKTCRSRVQTSFAGHRHHDKLSIDKRDSNGVLLSMYG